MTPASQRTVWHAMHKVQLLQQLEISDIDPLRGMCLPFLQEYLHIHLIYVIRTKMVHHHIISWRVLVAERKRQEKMVVLIK